MYTRFASCNVFAEIIHDYAGIVLHFSLHFQYTQSQVNHSYIAIARLADLTF